MCAVTATSTLPSPTAHRAQSEVPREWGEATGKTESYQHARVRVGVGVGVGIGVGVGEGIHLKFITAGNPAKSPDFCIRFTSRKR